MRPGLVSVSFRQRSVSEVAAATAAAGLSCIEWGGDVHVPHGDLSAAREAARISSDLGLAVSAYGSYLRLGADKGRSKGPSPASVVETAVVLGAPVIRVWAGDKGSADYAPEERAVVVEAAWELACLAECAGLIVAYEYHSNTLTDTAASVRQLLEESNHPALRIFWQPPLNWSPQERLEGLRAVLPRLANVHAYHWRTAQDRRPLEEGAPEWATYLEAIRNSQKCPDVLLEFVPHDDPALLPQEAATLRRWLDASPCQGG